MSIKIIKAANFKNINEALTAENIQKNTCDMLAAMRTNLESLLATYALDVVKINRTSGITTADARQMKAQVGFIEAVQNGRAYLGQTFAIKSSFATA